MSLRKPDVRGSLATPILLAALSLTASPPGYSTSAGSVEAVGTSTTEPMPTRLPAPAFTIPTTVFEQGRHGGHDYRVMLYDNVDFDISRLDEIIEANSNSLSGTAEGGLLLQYAAMARGDIEAFANLWKNSAEIKTRADASEDDILTMWKNTIVPNRLQLKFKMETTNFTIVAMEVHREIEDVPEESLVFLDPTFVFAGDSLMESDPVRGWVQTQGLSDHPLITLWDESLKDRISSETEEPEPAVIDDAMVEDEKP